MTIATSDSLAKAIAYLGAVEVAPGRYAMTWGKRWYVTDAEGVELTRLLGGGEMIAHIPTVMPSWWTPERRFALKFNGKILCVGDKADILQIKGPRDILVTADLETGQEVEA